MANNDQNESGLPLSNADNRDSANLLPRFFRTDSNKKFLKATTTRFTTTTAIYSKTTTRPTSTTTATTTIITNPTDHFNLIQQPSSSTLSSSLDDDQETHTTRNSFRQRSYPSHQTSIIPIQQQLTSTDTLSPLEQDQRISNNT